MSQPQPKTFEQWLLGYCDRDTPLGDLARDYRSELRLNPLHPWDQLWYGGCVEARDAYRRARRSYAQYLSRRGVGADVAAALVPEALGR